jgi:hypothetical protein
MMKTLIIAIALAAASAAASAESPTAAGPVNQAATAVISRAAVLQELAAARAAGTLIRAGELGQVPVPFVSVRDPADVRSEMLQSRRIAPYGLGYQPA